MTASEAHAPETHAIERRRRARRGLAVYLGVVVVLSALIEGLIMARGGPLEEHVGLVFALMWTPTLAMIVARVALREGVKDVSFRLGLRDGGWREWLVAWLYPVGVGAAAYGLAWATGLAPFAVSDGLKGFIGDPPAPIAVALSLGLTLTLGTALSALTATGEELGWRGYMLTRLIDAGVPRPALVSGAIWALWHAPLILSGQYAAGPSPVLSTATFFVGMLAVSYVFARVRLASGSVWPAVLFHAAWNAVIQGAWDGFVPGHGASHAGNVWVGESGVLVLAAHLVAAPALTWVAFRVQRFPKDPKPRAASVRTL
ncbi:MAG TPA: type II CAAX endopeptidase family protein [Sandaracinaceae bacterium LLY-WYZ-13_1]|nr:type II CAAX endopeptidase family protein [Sandaracinaceae bacterium LLY-WYZ-13_1]